MNPANERSTSIQPGLYSTNDIYFQNKTPKFKSFHWRISNFKFVECRSIEKNSNMNEPSENSIRNISFKHIFKGLIQYMLSLLIFIFKKKYVYRFMIKT